MTTRTKRRIFSDISHRRLYNEAARRHVYI